jgi:hypothetical protein
VSEKVQELHQRNGSIDFLDRAFRWDSQNLERGMAEDVNHSVDIYPVRAEYRAAGSAPNATIDSATTSRASKPVFL